MKTHKEGGFSYAYVALVLAFVILPLSVAAADLVRVAWARGELQKAADAAAEAGAQMADVYAWKHSSVVQLLPDAPSVATQVAQANSAYLFAKQIYPQLDFIVVDETANTVRVGLSATVQRSLLYGSQLRISAEGTSELRLNRN
ncbi:MAG: hypothetical protein JW850_07870 [Thermoflexales bacterium]|nr:hypothetical protein [Thermoflexales bacterium]